MPARKYTVSPCNISFSHLWEFTGRLAENFFRQVENLNAARFSRLELMCSRLDTNIGTCHIALKFFSIFSALFRFQKNCSQMVAILSIVQKSFVKNGNTDSITYKRLLSSKRKNKRDSGGE